MPLPNHPLFTTCSYPLTSPPMPGQSLLDVSSRTPPYVVDNSLRPSVLTLYSPSRPAYVLHVPTATSPRTTVPIDISFLLLPNHLRLTPTNWAAYKRSIPVLCDLRCVRHHLRPSDPALSIRRQVARRGDSLQSDHPVQYQGWFTPDARF